MFRQLLRLGMRVVLYGALAALGGQVCAQGATESPNPEMPHLEMPWIHVTNGSRQVEKPLTIAFWNIENFRHVANKSTSTTQIDRQLEAVGKVIQRAHPDILLASEVYSHETSKALNNQLKDPYPFIATTDYAYRNRPHREGMSCKRESMLFSRIPWTAIQELDFALINDQLKHGVHRGMLKVAFQIGGQRLVIYQAHFKSNFIGSYQRDRDLAALENVEKREQLSRLLIDDIRRSGLDPLKDRIIICGDLNTDVYQERFQGEKTVKIMTQAGFYNLMDDLPPDQRITINYRQEEGHAIFDYFLSSVGLGKRPVAIYHHLNEVGAQQGSDNYASDHSMILMTL